VPSSHDIKNIITIPKHTTSFKAYATLWEKDKYCFSAFLFPQNARLIYRQAHHISGERDTEAIRAETAAIKGDTSHIPLIRQDTAQIAILVQEITPLRLQVLEQVDSRHGIILEWLLDDTNSYAETVLDDQILNDEAKHPGSSVSTPGTRSRMQSLATVPIATQHTLSQDAEIMPDTTRQSPIALGAVTGSSKAAVIPSTIPVTYQVSSLFASTWETSRSPVSTTYSRQCNTMTCLRCCTLFGWWWLER
jgi:hypothetical protein